ncbi:MAG: AI-2E family transporter [Candidatus Pacearchaeota archaeon]|jgi:predicted PurR-regulated permease PerM
MGEEDINYLNKFGSTIILIVLLVLSFFLLKSILMSVLLGLLLAFVSAPAFIYLNKWVKSKNLLALLICLIFAAIIIIPIWFLTPVLLRETMDLFTKSQTIDFVTPLKNVFPQLFATESFSNEVSSVIYSFITKITNSAMNMVSNMILNLPTLILQLLVVIFVFFFTLRDHEKFLDYIRSILPFSKDVEKKLFKSSKDITFSVLYGQIVLGIIQGVVAGIGFFIVGIDNSLFLSLLAILAGILPIIGTAVVWVPVAVILLVKGQIWPTVVVAIFGSLSFLIENAFKPIFIAKRTNVHSAIILLGMIGGLFFLGILGIIIGPLILAYLLIILEAYRNKKVPGIIEPQS